MKKLFKREEGFTIIEVVLVLAIAGLIFLVVFLALPQLQASRRDTQRKNDAGRILAGAENFASNRNGVYPAAVDQAWVDENIPGDFIDPSGDPYVFVTSQTDLDNDDEGTVFYATDSQCPTDGTAGFASGAPRDIAVQMKLEAGVFCQDNR